MTQQGGSHVAQPGGAVLHECDRHRHGIRRHLVLSTTIAGTEGQFGSKEDARAMLQRAVAAVKENKDEALAKFNKGEDGFKDRDLYVFCANASDGVLTAHPYLKGENLKEIVGKKGFPLGQEIMQKATEAEIKEVSYWWPRQARMCRSRSTLSSPGWAIRTVESATTSSD